MVSDGGRGFQDVRPNSNMNDGVPSNDSAPGRQLRSFWLPLLAVSAPFLLATFPVVFLVAENSNESIRFYEVVFPLGILWIGIAAITLLSHLWLGSTLRAAVVAIVLVTAFYGYGVLIAQNEQTIGGVAVFRGR